MEQYRTDWHKAPGKGTKYPTIHGDRTVDPGVLIHEREGGKRGGGVHITSLGSILQEASSSPSASWLMLYPPAIRGGLGASLHAIREFDPGTCSGRCFPYYIHHACLRHTGLTRGGGLVGRLLGAGATLSTWTSLSRSLFALDSLILACSNLFFSSRCLAASTGSYSTTTMGSLASSSPGGPR